MTSRGHDIIDASRAYLGSAFYSHYKPNNLCSHGATTVDSCMERGLGADGQFDCSGLVIASIADVLKISPRNWPKNYRHACQLATLEERTRSKVGDIAVFHSEGSPVVHLGILAARMSVIHASDRTGLVEEGSVLGQFQVTIIPLEKLLELGFEATRDSINEKTTG